MSTSKKEIQLSDIKEAVLVNTCRPSESEEQHFNFTRFIRTSQNLEGNSQLGTILFVGVAKQFGFTDHTIQSYASLEKAEFDFKFKEFKDKLKAGQVKIATYSKYRNRKHNVKDDQYGDDDVRFSNKVSLVKNFLRLCR